MKLRNSERCRLDEDCFFILVDSTTFTGHVGKGWTLESLVGHVAQQASLGRIAAVYLGPHLQDLPVDVRTARSSRPSLREVTAVVEVRGKGLHVVDYCELTMADQFKKSPILQRPTESACVRLPSGRHRMTFRQLRDDDDIDVDGFWDSEEPALEVVVEPTEDDVEAVPGGIAWLTW